MDLQHIHTLIKDLEIDDPAFESTEFIISEFLILTRDGLALGAYYPNKNSITIYQGADETVALHEMGHRHADFYYSDLSEGAAESFRKVYQGNHNPHHSSSLPFYALCATLGAVVGLGLGLR
ncbi:unnamed protein product [marine sediment metagenome]|uniref:IrrE N-terminal-like domain-containing protein n=1 Tax=marine sediment metagenome TaxID=412755 RepID=X1S6J0_9ZZZZ